MAVKFTYSHVEGIRVECKEGAELTMEEAQVIGIRALANNVWALSDYLRQLIDQQKHQQRMSGVR